jgi:L-rhamnose isomerase
MTNASRVGEAYKVAAARYAELGVDVDAAMVALREIPISLHCWQLIRNRFSGGAGTRPMGPA